MGWMRPLWATRCLGRVLFHGVYGSCRSWHRSKSHCALKARFFRISLQNVQVEMAAQGELNWVNVLRAWSMAGVYLWHCEEYCGGGRTLSLFISPVCMAVFFFVSGYLFFVKLMDPASRRLGIINLVMYSFALWYPRCSLPHCSMSPKPFFTIKPFVGQILASLYSEARPFGLRQPWHSFKSPQ